MPKTSHGPEPKVAPPSLVVLLKEIEDRPFAADLWIKVSDAKDRAEALEERLKELHDAVEYAVDQLNERAAKFTYDGKGEDHIEVALARLNRVL